MSKPRYVLTLSCLNRPGIVAPRYTRPLHARRDKPAPPPVEPAGGDIREAQQFDDPETSKFFARIAFDLTGDIEALRYGLAPITERFVIYWNIHDHAVPRRVLLLVSKFDHCLADLLYRWRIGELPMTPVGIVSNHGSENYRSLDFTGVAFHHLPISRETKMEQEAQIFALVRETRAELVVLARYMQVLSDALTAKLAGRCINIHHSFLPGFKGAKPYHQAHGRGVKLIGATAHYVTADLDEGPIIEQDVERITHADTPDDLVRKGRDIERRVLARAVRHHLEDRVILNGKKTVVFIN